MQMCLKSTQPALKRLTLAVAMALPITSHAALFDNHVENGNFVQPNAVSHTFINNLTVNGSWDLNSTGNNTDMFFNGAQTIGGNGFINLSDSATNRLYSSGNNLLTIGADLTIRGAGQIGLAQTTFNNLGALLAQGQNAVMTLQSSSFANNGVVRAEGAAGLNIINSVVHNNQSIDVNNGSQITISSSTVNNGTLNNTGGGSLTAQSATLDNVTINGVMTHNNATTNTIKNGLTLNGSWNMNSSGSSTNLFFNGAQGISGIGEIVMSDNSNNRIYSAGNALLTIGPNTTIRGAGQIGLLQTHINNQGSIIAQGSNATLLIQSADFTNNGELRAEGSQGLVIQNTNLTNNTAVTVDNASTLQLISSTVDGVFNVAAGGLMTAQGTTFDGATINGDVEHNNAITNNITNGLQLNGNWNMNSTGSSTNLFFNGSQSITGNADIVMSDKSTNRIYSSANNLLTIGNATTIRGSGQLGLLQTHIDNQGSILAQGTDATLLIQSGSFTNNAITRAEGSAGMVIQNSTVHNNTSLDIDNGSQLLLNSSTVNGGAINNNAGGSFTAQNAGLNNVTVNGSVTHNNATTNNIFNDLTLNGSWNLNSTGSSTNLFFNGTQSILGNGEIVMSDNFNNRIYSSANNQLTVGNSTTIRGSGQLGLLQTHFDNQGAILAQGSSAEMLIQSGSFTNNGTLRAEGSAGLRIQNTTLHNNTSVDVNAGSSLSLISSTVDGTFNIAAGGTASAQSVNFTNATINGELQHNNSSTNNLFSGLTINGRWNMNSTGSSTNLIANGSQTITGNGEIVMSDNINNRIYSSANNTLTIDNGITVRGAGQIGLNQTQLVNKGTITADGSSAMTIQSSGTGFDNQGNLNASGSGAMNISGNFTNSGNVVIDNGSLINRSGTFVQTAGMTNVNGTLQSSGLVDIQGGLLAGNGLITGDVSNDGIVGPGNSAGLLSIDGDFSQSAIGLLDIELGGLLAGSEYDVLDITGTANLAGTLEVSLIDGFAPTIGDSFDILTAETLNGSFDILTLAFGNSNWQVQYLIDEIGTTDVVRLTALSSVPVPAAVWLFGSGLLGLIGVARRRK